jgi:hypothetical protein
MRRLAHLMLLLPLAFALPVLEAGAADPAPATTPSTAEKVTTAPAYQPPARGKPRGRVGGGTRGAGSTLPALTALVPDHTGETLAAQPSLFWNLAPLPPAGAKLVFVLTNEESIEPLIEAELARPAAAGIQRVDLATYGVELRTGLEYEWSVTLTMDPARRSRDLVTVGWIERVEPPDGLSTTDPAALGVAGFWYDAFAAAPAGLRQTLLRDAGLAALAAP